MEAEDLGRVFSTHLFEKEAAHILGILRNSLKFPNKVFMSDKFFQGIETKEDIQEFKELSKELAIQFNNMLKGEG